MFKMILSAIVALGFSTVAFAQEPTAPAAGNTPKSDAMPAPEKAANTKDSKMSGHKGHGKKKHKKENAE